MAEILERVFLTIPEAEQVAQTVTANIADEFLLYGFSDPPRVSTAIVYQVLRVAVDLGFISISRPTLRPPDPPSAVGEQRENSQPCNGQSDVTTPGTAGR